MWSVPEAAVIRARTRETTMEMDIFFFFFYSSGGIFVNFEWSEGVKK